MKVLFAHDGPVGRDDLGNFYSIQINHNLIERYLYLGDQLTIIIREEIISPQEKQESFQLNSERVNIVVVPNFKSVSGMINSFGKAKNIIYKTVMNHDVLITRLPTSIGSLAVKSAKKNKIPFIIEYVGCAYDSLWNYNWKGKLLAHYKMMQQKLLMKNVPYTIYVTKFYLQQKYPTNGRSINCSNVELKNNVEGTLINRIQKIQNYNSEKLTLGTVAAIDVPYKGQDDVIEAIGRLKKEGRDVYYKIVGNGDPERLKRIIIKHNVEDRIKIIGSLRHEKIFDFLNEIDLYIQPSKQEGLPRALVEAMNQACPALGARTAGIPELLSDECIFTPGSISQIVEKIKLVNIHWLEREGKINFEASKDYLKPILQLRRLVFYKEFLQDSGLPVPNHLINGISDLETNRIHQL
jgi:glycosyltransferase involved in cell wall biosynthesis